MKKILIVDDQRHLQDFFSEEIKDERYRVMSVTDAGSVSECLQNSKPDVVLLDLYLDGFEGWDVLNDIKARYPNLPVIIVTAYDNYADDPRLLQADGYVVKSFSALDKLKEKIAEVVN